MPYDADCDISFVVGGAPRVAFEVQLRDPAGFIHRKPIYEDQVTMRQTGQQVTYEIPPGWSLLGVDRVWDGDAPMSVGERREWPASGGPGGGGYIVPIGGGVWH